MSFVFLVVKLRVVPPTIKVAPKEDAEPPKKGDPDEQFLLARGEAGEMPKGAHDGGWAHASKGMEILLDRVKKLGARILGGKTAVDL